MANESICKLRATRYQVVLSLTRNDRTGAGEATLSIVLDPACHLASISSPPMLISVSDLHRTAEYLEEHMALLRQRCDAESIVFVPLELGFQMQAMEGGVDADGSGFFALRFMISMPLADGDGGNLYVGCEGEVSTEEVRAFIASVRAAIAELGLAD